MYKRQCYAVYHGPEGLGIIARRIQRMTSILAEGFKHSGISVENGHYFDTLTISAGETNEGFYKKALAKGINLRKIGSSRLGITLDETTAAEDIQILWEVFSESNELPSLEKLDSDFATGKKNSSIPQNLVRNSDFLTHPVFHQHQSETAMLRYLRCLHDKDIALDK